jgi:hypothetical protein
MLTGPVHVCNGAATVGKETLLTKQQNGIPKKGDASLFMSRAEPLQNIWRASEHPHENNRKHTHWKKDGNMP